MKNKDFVSSKFIYVLVSLFFAIVLFFNANAVLLKNSNDRTNASETHSTTSLISPHPYFALYIMLIIKLSVWLAATSLAKTETIVSF